MSDLKLPKGMERIYLEVTIDTAEKRAFYHGRDESPADIDWAYHLRMGDLRFAEEARLATVPLIENSCRKRLRDELLAREIAPELLKHTEEVCRKRWEEEQKERWKQALDFCLGSMGEYGEGTPEHGAYKNAHTFLTRLAPLQATREGGSDA